MPRKNPRPAARRLRNALKAKMEAKKNHPKKRTIAIAHHSTGIGATLALLAATLKGRSDDT